MKAAGIAVPTHVSGTFLLDTGASNTVVDTSLIAPLGITPTGTIMCHTPSTGTVAQAFNQYDVAIIVPGAVPGQAWVVEALPVMESNLAPQGIQGLIGRDMLDDAILIYNGTTKHFTLAF